MRLYEASFKGRQKNALGIFYHINVKIKGANKYDARLALYRDYDHIQNLELREIIDENARTITNLD